MPTAPGESVVLAAWDGASMLYTDTNNLPTTMPCVRHVLSLTAGEIVLSSNLTHSFQDYGYGIGTGPGGQGTLPGGIHSMIISSNLVEALVERTTNLLASTANRQTIPATFITNSSGDLEYQLPIEHPQSFVRIKLTP